MRRSLVFAGLFVVAAIGLVLLWRSLDAPSAPIEPTAALSTPSERSSEVPVASSLTGGEDSPSLEAAENATEIRTSAAATDVDSKRTENFALDDARWLEGRVLFPLGTPADEALEVWAISSPVNPLRGTRASLSDTYTLVRAAQENQTTEWAVRPVERDGSYRVPAPKGLVTLVLTGRYLYLPAPLLVKEDAGAESRVLEPMLGGHLVVRCTAPAGLEKELIGSPTTLYGYKLDSRAMRRGGGGLNRQGQVAPDLSVEERAVPAELNLTLVVSPTTLAVATHSNFRVEPGQRTEITLDVQPGARIRGTVRDDQGAPVAGAEIESEEQRFNMMRNFGNSQRTTLSADDGSFELVGLRAGKTHLSAQHEGHVSARTDELELAVGATIDGIAITLSRGYQLKGRVTWPDQTPASGATVSARGPSEASPRGGRRMRPRRSSEGVTVSTIADESGEFTLPGLGDGPFRVQAGQYKRAETPHPFFADDENNPNRGPLWTASMVDVAAGASGLLFVLQEPKGLKGRVVDDVDAPVTKFRVTATPANDGGTLRSDDMGRAISDVHLIYSGAGTDSFQSDAGAFLIGGLQDGKYAVEVDAEGYVQTGEKPSAVVPQSDEELVIRLVRTGSASGRVVDPSGHPVAGATVSADVPGGNGGPFNFGNDDVSADSDENGNFAIDAVPSGTIQFTASAEDWAKSEPLSAQIAPRQTTSDLVIVMRTGGRLTGEIFDASGAPHAGRAIQMFSMDAGDMRSMIADAAGRFEADHLTPGSYQLIAQPGEKELAEIERTAGEDDPNPAAMMSQMKMATAAIQDGETTHVVMGAPPKAPVRVTGTITRAGEAAGKRNVIAVAEGGSMLESMKAGSSDAAGRYELTLDKPGAVVLIVSESSSPERGIEFYETIPEVAEYQLDLALPLGGIRGRVRGPDHRPIAGVSVSLQSDRSATGLSIMGGGTNARTDENGRYEFADLHPGVFAVAAGGSMGRRFVTEDSPHGRSVRGGLRVEADKFVEDVDLELSMPGKITGRVLDANGAPAGGATVYVRDAHGELLHRFSACTSDASGHFAYEGVAPGKYTLCARTTTLAAPDSKPISVQENQTSEIDLALEPGTWLRISTEDGDSKTVRAQVSVRNDRDQEVSQMIAMDAIQSMFKDGVSSTEKRVGPLPSGKYVVTATTPAGKTTKKSITLKGQDERKVVLRLD
jgi:protocatechuate 3,4-dioxygenase beta subunit